MCAAAGSEAPRRYADCRSDGMGPDAMDLARPDLASDTAAERDQALAPFHVSRETTERLTRFVAFLLARQQKMNLIASSTIPMIWTRHVADSLQLLALAPDARRWVDLGSGAGFPGLVIASALADTPGAHVDLVESVGKKAAFLREAI